jgi:peroxiredoxin
MVSRRFAVLISFVAAAALCAYASQARAGEEINSLKVGDTAKDYEWETIGGDKIKLSELAADGPVVLVVLRGYPGYQCPICSRQVNELSQHAADFQQLGAKVALVYPGPAAQLREKAEEFLEGIALPEPLVLVTDPDYSFTNAYGLRWEAPRETAYPSTFVLDPNRVVKYAKISQSHGDRAKTADVLAAVGPLKKPTAVTGQ